MLGGIVLFRDNCADEAVLRQSIRRLRESSPYPIYIMIDEEGGRVRRLPDAESSMHDLRSYESTPSSEIAGHYTRVAERLRDLDIDTLLAPVVDIGHPDAEWLNSRTLSHDPTRVAEMAHAVIPAIQQAGVHACAKHFPGSGRVALDPHHGPVTSSVSLDDLKSHELIPFAAAIADAVDMILVGHQVMNGLGETRPACLTPAIPRMLLKTHMGFKGLVLTDDLGMGAIARAMPIEDAFDAALQAGCDLVLICNDRQAQRRAVEHWATQQATS